MSLTTPYFWVSEEEEKLMRMNRSRRKQDRIRAVLPVRVRGTDVSGYAFETLAHTLDLNSTGARLGAVGCRVSQHDTLVVLFRQRRVEFTVMWTRFLNGREYQVGLQAVAKESDPWGLDAARDIYTEASADTEELAGAA